MFSVKQSIEFARTLTAEHFICLAGLILLAYWLLRTSFGARALTDASPRRNSMPFYLPLIPLFIWFGPVPMAVLAAEGLAKNHLTDWQVAFLDNCIFSAGAVVTMAVILLLARAHFARRLKGFGLNVKTIFADFFAGFVNLLTVWPLIVAAVIATQYVGEQIWGQDYQMQQHQELKLITENSQLPLRIIIVTVAVVVAPLLEEMLFRGLIQTAIGNWLLVIGQRPPLATHQSPITIHQLPFTSLRPWLAIIMSSGLFAIMHANAGHWPALFALSVCLGHAYEKSGSLFRPIFIHAFFNAISITDALSQG